MSLKNAARGASRYMMRPEELVIPGIDTPHKRGQHDLWRDRTHKRYATILKGQWDEGLLHSIDQMGVQKDVWVRRDGDVFLVVDGARRVLYAREVNRARSSEKDALMLQVPAAVKTGSGAALMGLKHLGNSGAEDDDLLYKADGAQRMLDQGMTRVEVCAHFAWGTQQLTNALSLLNLAEPLKVAVRKGEAAPTALLPLVRLSEEQQLVQFEELKKTGKVTEAAARVRVANVKAEANGEPTKWQPNKRVLRRMIDDAELALGIDGEASFWLGVKFALGDVAPTKVKGMTAALKKHEPKPKQTKERAAKAAEAAE